MEHVFTDANFEQEVLKSDIPVFVDFWAPWCGPCQMTGPFIEELAGEMDPTKLKIGKLNVDDNPVTAGKYEIMSIPTFAIFKNGEVVDQTMGGQPKESLAEFMKKNI